MELSKKSEYALRALLFLAETWGDGVVKTKEIAEQASIPQSFLEQILLQLNTARILESVKGAEGGYRLRKPPEEINIGNVIRIFEGALAPMHDLEKLNEKVDNSGRFVGLYKLLLEVRNAVSDVLDNTTLAELTAENQRIRNQQN